MGFEPMVRSRESLVFKTSSINHSDTSPQWLPPECRYYYTKIRRGCQPLRANFFENYFAVNLTVDFLLRFAQMFFVLGPSALRQHRIIPALRLKHRSGGSPRQEPPQAAVALRSASLRLGVRHGICVAKMLDNTQSIICAFGLASAAPRSPYRHLELCGIALRNAKTAAVLHRGGKIFGDYFTAHRG